MKLKLFLTLLLVCLGVPTISRAGISVTSPGSRNGYFYIYYGLGTPAPGKIAYVSVRRPDGYQYTVAQAENVPDYSQLCYVYADQIGTYRFFYEYSYVSQGVPRTTVYTQDYYISSGNNINWGSVTSPSPAVGGPGTSATITVNFSNSGTSFWGGNHYIEFKDYVGTVLYYASVSGIYPGGIGTRSTNVTLPNIGGIGTATYHLRAIEGNVEYFGAVKDVPIVIDYAPWANLSVSASSITTGQTVTITSNAGDAYGNMNYQTIDYLPPGGSWTQGASWSGYSGSNTLAINNMALNTTGTWTFHARSFDTYGQASAPQYQYVTVNPPVATTFSFSGGPTYTYDGLVKSVSATPSPSNATYSQSGTWSAINVGSYSATATANGGFTGSGSYNWSIVKANQSAVFISPNAQTVAAGSSTSITFTASGGTSSGNYIWGGDASGTGSSKTVTFPTVGTRYVTVYRQGDGNYNDSSTAVATITVNSGTQVDTSNQNQLSIHLPLAP